MNDRVGHVVDPDLGADVGEFPGVLEDPDNRLTDRNGPPWSVTNVIGTTSRVSGSVRYLSRSTPRPARTRRGDHVVAVGPRLHHGQERPHAPSVWNQAAD